MSHVIFARRKRAMGSDAWVAGLIGMLGLALFPLEARSTAASGPAFSATPAAAMPHSTQFCTLHVALLDIPYDPTRPGLRIDGGAQNYVVALQSDGASTTASGTIAFYVGDDRYIATFRDAVAAGRDESLNLSTPIAVTFPSAVPIAGAYVATLNVGTSLLCGPTNVWLSGRQDSWPPPSVDAVPAPLQLLEFERRAASITPSLATLQVHEAHPPCARPDALPTQLHLAKLVYPRTRETGWFSIALTLDPSGKARDAYIFKASVRSPQLEAAALRSALESTFDPGTFRCEPIYGTYSFTAVFGAP